MAATAPDSDWERVATMISTRMPNVVQHWHREPLLPRQFSAVQMQLLSEAQQMNR